METQEASHLSAEKTKLLSLEAEGNYVFHGSPTQGIEKLSPRQAFTVVAGTNERIPDGPPGVAASPYCEIAIFRALVKGRSGFQVSNGTLKFTATKEALEKSRDSFGYVYLLPKADFYPKNGHEQAMDWRCDSPITPIEEIKVSFNDLPSQIEIIEA